MFAEIPAWKDTVWLTPDSGIQCLDFAFDIEALPRKSRGFIERMVLGGETSGAVSASGQDGHNAGGPSIVPLELIAVPEAEDEDALDPRYVPSGQDDSYEINRTRALEPFLEKWVPLPVLRLSGGRDAAGRARLDQGPTNWARARVVEVPSRDSGGGVSHRVVLAFDTALLQSRPNRPYTAPAPQDAIDEMSFQLAHAIDDISWFLSDTAGTESGAGNYQEWVDEWLRTLFYDFKEAQRPGRFRPEQLEHKLEHWARYIAFLGLLHEAIDPPTIRLIDTLSREATAPFQPKTKSVEVDLVLDVGNSRTCGVLIESYPNERGVDLNNSMVLRLRDLSRPEQIYTDPFASHVELAQADFGPYDLSRLSTREKAFFWPSAVRVGPEALRTLGDAEGTEEITGMSSPKRYLWDCRPVNQEWRFQPGDYGPGGEPPPIDLALRRYMRSNGDILAQLRAEKVRLPEDPSQLLAERLSFSRSSFFSLMTLEIVMQALTMINEPGVRARRKQSNLPRRLRRIIFTLPPATPIQEQKILRSRIEGALKLLWQLMDWLAPEGADNPWGRDFKVEPPKVQINLDEASCIHFVYLYGEIAQKLGGGASDFADLIGRPRAFAEPEQAPERNAEVKPSIRLASVDIGGGTSDLMITTYYVEDNRALIPTQHFREGFKIAGDDLLKGVIDRIVLPAFEEGVRQAGATGAGEILKLKFGGDRAGMAEQEKHLRRQFVLQVLQPAALAILAAYENAPEFAEDTVERRTLAELLAPDDLGAAPGAGARGSGAAGASVRNDPQQSEDRLFSTRLSDYLETAAGEAGAEGFRVEDVEIPLDFAAVRAVTEAVLGGVADNLCEAVEAFECDALILSGRPTRLKAVVDLFIERLPLPPDRIVPLSDYRAGIWYPFRSSVDNTRIMDPKTGAAVGGMLCALAEGQLQNFTLFSHRLAMRSTARFIGPLELNGQLKADRVLFEDVDLDAPGAAMEAELRYFAPMRIGFRQLPYERWTTTPLYRLEIDKDAGITPADLPVDIILERDDVAIDEEEARENLAKRVDREASREGFTVTSATASGGDRNLRPKRDIVFTLDTLSVPEGYWLDTGIIGEGPGA
ncbi:MAG: virulence factor SrfB [Pseudomonadota bacterium]